MNEFMGTTICAVKKDGKVAIAGDGQVTMSNSIIFKSNAKKVRRIYDGKVIFGFAGSVSDAFALSEKFEAMLAKYSGNLTLLVVSGSGEVIEPDGGVCAIGSGGNYALAAARALVQETKYSAKEIATKALKIASEICVFTNDNIICEEL